MNPARRLFPVCVSPLSFTHLRFGVVNPYGTSCVSTSRSLRRFSHRHFGFRNLYNPSCMSTVGSPRPFAHRHFGFDNPHALGAGRLSPLSHDSLVAISCSLINFSSRAFSRWVHMDLAWGLHLESLPLLASSGALGRSGPVSDRCPRPIKAPIDRTMISAHFGLQRVSGLIWGPKLTSSPWGSSQ